MKKRNPLVDKKVKDIFPGVSDVKAKAKPVNKPPIKVKAKMPC